MLSAHDPGQDYTTISGYENATQSTKMPQSTKTMAKSNATTTSLPNCMADGAPWYSPTTWCDCGPSMTFPTIAFASNATSPTPSNCAYQSLDPSKTIHPISTSAPPTNIPGQGGLPQCVYVLAAPDNGCPGADYCDCGGTYTGLMTTTISYTVSANCNYTVQPSATSCPAPASYFTVTSSTTTAAPNPTTGGIIRPTLVVNPCNENTLFNFQDTCVQYCGGGTCVAFPIVGNNSPRWYCQDC